MVPRSDSIFLAWLEGVNYDTDDTDGSVHCHTPAAHITVVKGKRKLQRRVELSLAPIQAQLAFRF